MKKREDILSQINKLTPGYITEKKINNKTYYYHQWKDSSGRTIYRSVPEQDALRMRAEIEERKALQYELKSLEQEQWMVAESSSLSEYALTSLNSNALYGETLSEMSTLADGLEKRDCYHCLEDYLYGEPADKVCLLYGLRRTGKTTLIRQIIADMDAAAFDKTIYIKATQSDTVAALNKDLKLIRGEGFKYVFIDEVTLISDFIDSAALLSDVYAAGGMKIVLSGTDSLGFYFASRAELYDRADMIHTTFIPFREHERLLHIENVDEYIKYGGTLKAGSLDLEKGEVIAADASFKDDESTRRYIDTAICRNIQHSLECYGEGGHFRHLKELFEKGDLTNAINRIIQDMNHNFTVEVITRDFVSRDLKSAAQMLRSAANEDERSDALDEIDTSGAVKRLMKLLDIRNKEDLNVTVTDIVAEEIREYLKALDLIYYADVETLTGRSSDDVLKRIIFTQPGMRYCQAEALIYSLIRDQEFDLLREREKNLIIDKISQDVMGVMLEDIILLETSKKVGSQRRVFKLLMDAGEFDMVIYDAERDCCELYEVKHSKEMSDSQWKNFELKDDIERIENRFGKIVAKTVIYNGESCTLPDGRCYLNAAEYLKRL